MSYTLNISLKNKDESIEIGDATKEEIELVKTKLQEGKGILEIEDDTEENWIVPIQEISNVSYSDNKDEEE